MEFILAQHYAIYLAENNHIVPLVIHLRLDWCDTGVRSSPSCGRSTAYRIRWPTWCFLLKPLVICSLCRLVLTNFSFFLENNIGAWFPFLLFLPLLAKFRWLKQCCFSGRLLLARSYLWKSACKNCTYLDVCKNGRFGRLLRSAGKAGTTTIACEFPDCEVVDAHFI